MKVPRGDGGTSEATGSKRVDGGWMGACGCVWVRVGGCVDECDRTRWVAAR